MKTVEFKVASVSKNANSFGLRGYVLIAMDGTAFEIGRSDCAAPWAKGRSVFVECSDEGHPLARSLGGCELFHPLPKAPPKVRREVWSDPHTYSFQVGAYRPAGENNAVLVPLLVEGLARHSIGPVVRREEAYQYGRLLNACDGNPIWMYNQEPSEL